MQARLILEDGSVFKGISRGAPGEAWGEVVFNTSMTGYQEIITDPASAGQILTMTFPLIGNQGLNKEDLESRRPFLRGFIAREMCSTPHNRHSPTTIGNYLREQNIVAMEGLDTRALTRLLRKKGSERGLITTEKTAAPLLVEKAKKLPTISELELVSEVTTPRVYSRENRGPHVIILDLGLRRSLTYLLHQNGYRITVVPAFYQAGAIMELGPDGVVLSGGPGDPLMARAPLKTTRELFGQVPMLGIGLGHQILALGLGAKTYKLKLGHRGANHPVKDLFRNKIYITSQNHGFAVSEEGLPPGLEVTHINLHDQTVEGLRENRLKVTSIQYHPQTFPALTDLGSVFEFFLEDIKNFAGSRR